MPSVLMVEPDHYKIEYAINPFMLDEKGQLKKVDSGVAKIQWDGLVQAYKKLGVEVHVMKARPGLPDMVYAANNAIVFVNPKSGKKTALMGQMKSSFRQPEIAFFEKWYANRGYVIEHLNDPASFEGCGDALFRNKNADNVLWGGYGHRTDKNVYVEIADRFAVKVILLELIHPSFYHLDTCFVILNEDTVAIQMEAFKKPDLDLIQKNFKNVINVELKEASENFATNCFCPNGRDVIVQRGSPGFINSLQKLNFQVHEIETSEFIKGGGSVFCLKMALL